MTDNLFYVNGVNGTTGEYGLPPIINDEFASTLGGGSVSENTDKFKQNLKWQLRLEMAQKTLETLETGRTQTQDTAAIDRYIEEIKKEIRQIKDSASLGVAEKIKDPNDLSQTGWGIIFANHVNPAIKDALNELIEWRKKQATKNNGNYFRCFDGADGYYEGQTYLDFLTRYKIGPGPVDPDKGVPYYLLIVGSPAVIPYRFQYQLDIQFAVGRLDFGDDFAAYAQYARNLVAIESGEIELKLPRRATFFGTANRHDNATRLSAKNLIKPLYDSFTAKENLAIAGWQFDITLPEQATRAGFEQIINGDQMPALLFTATHGMEFDMDDKRQIPHQGALLCQDWPGKKRWGNKRIPEQFYFSADHLDGKANLLGSMAFNFSCYSAGTPQYDEFTALQKGGKGKQIAIRPFTSTLPQKMLTQGALAVVGHVERAWGYSFFWPRAGKQVAVFESTLESLFKGNRIGYALEYFNQRYAELAAVLSVELENVHYGRKADRLPFLWTANNDARNYVVIGDPAARLPVVEPADATITPRPAVTKVNYITPLEVEATSFALSTPSEEVNGKNSKPVDSISDEDWQDTPPEVQKLLIQSVELINKLREKLDGWEY